MSDIEESRFGEVALIGRPNVGKSTLLNGLIGQKISITSAKPHTTRQRILGILNYGQSQIVFVDTPGHARRSKKALHRLMSRTIHQAVAQCDLCLLLIEATGLKPEDRQLIEMLGDDLRKTIIVVNKLDLLKSRAEVLPVLEDLQALPCLAFVPISARRALNTDRLVAVIAKHLPPGEPMFPSEMSTDRSLTFRAEELIRGELLTLLHKEVPYGLTVEIEHMSRGEDGAWLVHGLIWLERQSHKPIVIGKRGEQLKRVGIRAREELEKLLAAPVRLELWVKVREHWADSERELKRLGFDVT